MDEDKAAALLNASLHEYDKLKDEQTKRIEFRDHMIFVTLGAVGGVASFAVSGSDPSRLPVLLLVPWVCFVLGWTYLVNDEKISAIGKYLRLTLVETLRAHVPVPETQLFGWEIAHRDDERRRERKVFQLFVDLLTFCLSGLAAIVFFWIRFPSAGPAWLVVSLFEGLLLIVLAVQMILYADLRRGR